MRYFFFKPHIILSLLLTGFMVLSFAYVPTIAAAPNAQINYQGKLTDSTNAAVADGNYNIRFWLLTSPTAATSTAIWTESLTGANQVPVTNGLFSVMLGSTSPLTNVDFNQTLYLGVEIGGTGAAVWDGEMSPRKILGTVPAAFEADRLDGLTSSQFVRTDATTTIATSSTDTLLTIIQNGAGDILNLFDGGNEVFSVVDGGNIGIGSSTPSRKLTVNGEGYFANNVTMSSSTIADAFITNATTTNASSTNLFATSGFFTNLKINALRDSANSLGTNGMVLQSNGSTAQWVSTTSLGIASSLTGGTDGYLARWNSASTLTTGLFRDNGTVAGVNATNSTTTFLVQGTAGVTNAFAVASSSGTNFVVTDAGDVGIGTAAPITQFHVTGGSAGISLQRTGGSEAFIRISGANVTTSGAQIRGLATTQGLRFTDAGGTTEWGRFTSTGSFGVGSATPSRKLTVNGEGYFANNVTMSSSTIADAFITNATTTNASSTNLFATSGFFTNLKINALRDSANSLGTNGMVLQSNGSTAQWVATNTLGLGGAGGGTVTSVDMTVPTGLTVTGNPITTAGTLALSYDAGYTGVLTASTTEWARAYASTTALNATAPLNYAPTTGTFSITADGIGDTQLAFDTGQHLTTTSIPTFAGLLGTGSSTIASLTVTNGTTTNATSTNLFATLFRATNASSTYASSTALSLFGRLFDSTNSAGTNGMVLQTTGNGTQWVSTSSLGIASSLSGGTDGYLARWNSASTLTTGLFRDNGTVSGVNATNSTTTFFIRGTGSQNPFSVSSSTGSTLFTITKGGNVGIGTTTPLAALTIVGDGEFDEDGLHVAASTGNRYVFTQYNTGDDRGRIGAYDYDADTLKPLSIESSYAAFVGDIGIGTGLVAPGAELEIYNPAAEYSHALFTNLTTGIGDGNGFEVGAASDGAALLWNAENTLMAFGTNNTERMVILGNGNVGIGTSSPSRRLTVQGGDIWLGGNFTATGTASMTSLIVSATSSLTYASTTGLSATNLASTNSLITNGTTTNASSTNLFATLFRATNASSTYASSTGITATDLYTNRLTFATTTSGVLVVNTTGGTAASSTVGDGFISDALTVSGGTIGSNNISGTLTTTGTLTIGDGGDAINIDSSGWDINNSILTNLSGLIVTGSSTLGYASSTALTATNLYGTNALLTYASTTGITATNVHLSALRDSAGSLGTNGMVLQTNGSTAQWVSTTSLGIASSLTGGTDGYLARWNSASTLTTGLFRDNGTVAGVNATNSTTTFMVQGTAGLDPFAVASSTGAALFSVNQNGNVGVGTNTPNRLFTVVGGAAGAETVLAELRSNGATSNTGTTLKFVNSTTGGAGNGGGEISVLRTSNLGDMIFRVGDTNGTIVERMRIAGTGNIGIGTSSPSRLLTVQGGDFWLGGNFTATGTASMTSLIVTATSSLTYASTTGISATNFASTNSLITNGTTTNATSTNLFATNVRLSALRDSTNSLGTNGMILQTNGTAATWVATNTLGLGITGGTDGYLARWTGATSLSTGLFRDNGTVAGVNATNSTTTFMVRGTGSLNPFTVASSTGANLFTVLANGNVGIGMDPTQNALAVLGENGGTNLYISNGAGQTVQLFQDSVIDGGLNSILYTGGSFAIYDESNDESRFHIASTSGFVGIGSIDPEAKLHIVGDGTNYDQLAIFEQADAALLSIRSTNGGRAFLELLSEGVSDFIISNEGDGRMIFRGQSNVNNPGVMSLSDEGHLSIATTSSWIVEELVLANNVGSTDTMIGFTNDNASGLGYAMGINAEDDRDVFVIHNLLSDVENLVISPQGKIGIGGTTTPTSILTMSTSTVTGSQVAGIKQHFGFTNSTLNALYYGNETYIVNAPTATSTLVGSMLRIEDTSALGNTVRGLEVQAYRGTNTKGENTALSGFGRTFGVRGTTIGDAGSTFLPAGVFAESQGTTQGNALRAYSGTLTTEDLVYLFHDTSNFTGTGLLMNFGNSGGSFAATSSTARFVDLQVAGTSKFIIAANGSTTIGDGTVNAGLIIPRGGICVDNDGSCISTTTGQIRSVTSALGNSDLAEIYFSGQSLKTGEIVSLKGGLSVERADGDTEEHIIGVVSTKPGMTLGYDDTSLVSGENGYPIGLKGRVPVKLSTENGPIKKGDRIALSSIPGVGMKATESSRVVGIALEDFDGTKAFTSGFLNQFGDDLVKERIATKTTIDPKTQDGCYHGGGAALGEEKCTPDKVTQTTVTTVTDNSEYKAVLNMVATEDPVRMETEGGEDVYVGQALMFIELGWYQLASESQILSELLATTTDGEVEDTLWSRIKTLATNFVDGVLTITGLKADRIEVKNELCVDDVCVTADDLRALLNAANIDSSPSNDGEMENDPEEEVQEENEGENGGGEGTPPAEEEENEESPPVEEPAPEETEPDVEAPPQETEEVTEEEGEAEPEESGTSNESEGEGQSESPTV